MTTTIGLAHVPEDTTLNWPSNEISKAYFDELMTEMDRCLEARQQVSLVLHFETRLVLSLRLRQPSPTFTAGDLMFYLLRHYSYECFSDFVVATDAQSHFDAAWCRLQTGLGL